MNEAGDINAIQMQFEDELKPMEFTRKPRPKELTKDELKNTKAVLNWVPVLKLNFILKGKRHCTLLLRVSQNMNWCLPIKIHSL